MPEPPSFGLSPAQTLAHVASGYPTPGFARVWRQWWSDIAHRGAWFVEGREAARFRSPAAAGAEGVTDVVETIDGARIGARLVFSPDARPDRGDSTSAASTAATAAASTAATATDPALVCVQLHGYAVEPGAPLTDDLPKPLDLDGPRETPPPTDPAVGTRAAPAAPVGLAVLKLRLRGYPGSQADAGELTRRPPGYAAHAVHDEHHWPVTLAVRDVVSALLACRRRWPRARLAMWGESFGGGLAAIAAGVLALAPDEAAPRLDRLVLALPTLGDWSWRLDHPATGGLGAEIAAFLDKPPAARAAAIRNLVNHDATYHARRIHCPVLCKLAAADGVVPAPAAAAVFNALGAGPGDKQRLVTRFGHYAPSPDADAAERTAAFADARRHVLFDRAALAFLDPAREPRDALHRLNALFHREQPIA